jgi:hypothetical protein
MFKKTKIVCMLLAVLMTVNFSLFSYHKNVYAFVDGGVVEGTVIGTVVAGALTAWGISTTTDIASSIASDFYDWGTSSGDKTITDLFADIQEEYNNAVMRGKISAFLLPFALYVKLSQAFKQFVASDYGAKYFQVVPQSYFSDDFKTIMTHLYTEYKSYFSGFMSYKGYSACDGLTWSNYFKNYVTGKESVVFNVYAGVYDDGIHSVVIQNSVDTSTVFGGSVSVSGGKYYISYGSTMTSLPAEQYRVFLGSFAYSTTAVEDASTVFEPTTDYAGNLTLTDGTVINAENAENWVIDNTDDQQKEVGIPVPTDIVDVSDTVDVNDGIDSENADTLGGFWENLGKALQNLLNGLLSPFKTVIEYLKKIWAWLIGFQVLFQALYNYLTSDNSTDDNTNSDDNSNVKNYLLDGLKSKFPFCIPFDFVSFVTVLSADPVTPKFDWTFTVPQLNLSVPLVIDLTPYDDVAKNVRRFQLIIFCIGLVLITRNIIKG